MPVNSRRLASLPGFSVDHVGGLGNPVGMGDRKAGTEDRLRRIVNPAIGRKEAEERVAGRQEKFQAQVTRAANKLGQSLRPSDEEELGKVRLKLLNAGFRNENAVAVLRHQADPHAPGLGDRLSDRGHSSWA